MRTVRRLVEQDGIGFVHRGMGRNIVAVRPPPRPALPFRSQHSVAAPCACVRMTRGGPAAAQVALPIAMTIFLTDAFTEMSQQRRRDAS